MVFREVSQRPTEGAVRSIVSVARAENEEWVLPMAHAYIDPGAHVMTDESHAFVKLSMTWQHSTVNHAEVFSDNGVSNNQAESFFARLRRMNAATRRMTPKYLDDYANEIAWREDRRRMPALQKVNELLGFCLQRRESNWWRGYWQGRNRPQEILFPIPQRHDPVLP